MIPFFKIKGMLTGKPPLFTTESLKAVVESNPYISCEKAKRELRYKVTPIDKTLADTLVWFRDNGYFDS